MKDKKTKPEQYYIVKMKNKNGGRLPDEREMQENSQALNTALVFGLIFDGVMILYYFITRNIEKSYPYWAQLLVIAVVFALMSFASKTVKPPHTLWGRTLTAHGAERHLQGGQACALSSHLSTVRCLLLLMYIRTKR